MACGNHEYSPNVVRFLGRTAIAGSGGTFVAEYNQHVAVTLADAGQSADRANLSARAAAQLSRSESAVQAAERSISAASTTAQISSALKDAQRALSGARREARSNTAKAQVRQLERRLDALRRQAENKDAELAAARHGVTASDLAGDLLANSAPYAHQARLPRIALSHSKARAEAPLIDSTRPALRRMQEITLSQDHRLSHSDLIANARYRYNDNIYETDHLARPSKSHHVITLVPSEERVRHNKEQRLAGKVGGRDSTVGGHLGAISLGGFPSGPNLINQDKLQNIQSMKRLENWASAETKSGRKVTYDISLADLPEHAYNADAVPFALLVTPMVDGARQDMIVLLNEPGQL